MKGSNMIQTWDSWDAYAADLQRDRDRQARERQIRAAKCPHGVSVNVIECRTGGAECDQYMTQD
jgi:hypothetical protein